MTKPLSENDLRRIVGISGKQTKKIQWHTTQIYVKQFLSIQEYLDTINNIVRDCVDKDGNIIVELLDFSTRVNIISSYAYVELPENYEDVYYIVYASDLYDVVCSNVCKSQIEAIKQNIFSHIRQV